MSDDKTFLVRWSRRQREAAPDTREQPKPENAGGGDAYRALLLLCRRAKHQRFPCAGAPADIARAALRRIWSCDPLIRDFVGLSENFNRPAQCRAWTDR
jgi:hypothetical protein